jgi:uncharacterized protein YkwD
MNRKIWLIALAGLLMTGLFAVSCNDEPDPEPQLTPKEKVIKAYKDEYLASELADPGWTGAVAGCVAGTVSQESHDKVAMRINYYRKLVGLPGDVTLDATLSAKAQQAALIMKANNTLSHYPPQSWTCWTQVGYDAAGSSNLAWSSNSGAGGNHSVNAITGYIKDPGNGNEAVGHRRWLLYSRAKVMGHGSTTNTNAIWVSGNNGNPIPSTMPEFVAYPTKDYMPAPLVFPRWSFSKPDASFSGASVTMTTETGANVPLTVIHKQVGGGGYIGDPTIVWEPQGINTSGPGDVKYHVKIENAMVGGTAKTYEYDVIIVQVTSAKKSAPLPSDAMGEVEYK